MVEPYSIPPKGEKKTKKEKKTTKCVSRLFGCMSLGFIARGYGLAGPSAWLQWATLLALLAGLL
jgi:hypothetical protein